MPGTTETKENKNIELWIITFLVANLWINSYLVGFSDKLLAGSLAVTAWLMTATTIRLHNAGRSILASHFHENSHIQDFLLKPGLIKIVIAFIASFALAAYLAISIRALTISHGGWAPFVILALITLIFSFILKEDYTLVIKSERSLLKNPRTADESRNAKEHLSKAIKDNSRIFIKVMVAAFIINFTLSILLSAKNTLDFVTNDVNLENWIAAASEKTISETIDNKYSKLMINYAILIDYAKIGTLNTVIDNKAGLADEKASHFWVFFPLVFIINFLKLIPFSIAYVILYQSIQERTEGWRLAVKETITRATQSKVVQKINEKAENMMKKQKTEQRKEENQNK